MWTATNQYRDISSIAIFFHDIYRGWNFEYRPSLHLRSSTFSALNYSGEIILFQIFMLSIRSCAHKSFRQFCSFRNFWPHFRKLWRHLATKMSNSIVHLKGWALQKKLVNCIKSTHKPRHNICSNYTARTNSTPASERDRKKTNTIFSHLQPTCVVRSSPTFARW